MAQRRIDNLNFCITIDWVYQRKSQQTWKIFKQIDMFFFWNKSKMVLIIFIIKSLGVEILHNAASFEPSLFSIIYDSTVSSYKFMWWIRNLKLCIEIDWLYFGYIIFKKSKDLKVYSTNEYFFETKTSNFSLLVIFIIKILGIDKDWVT